MERLWYVKIKGKQQGPYSIKQLKRHAEVTPDTLVWYAEVSAWVAMRNVPHLQDVFKDTRDNNDSKEEPVDKEKKLTHELVLELQSAPPPILLWLFAALTLTVLLLWQLTHDR